MKIFCMAIAENCAYLKSIVVHSLQKSTELQPEFVTNIFKNCRYLNNLSVFVFNSASTTYNKCEVGCEYSVGMCFNVYFALQNVHITSPNAVVELIQSIALINDLNWITYLDLMKHILMQYLDMTIAR